jgi:hypothetical protein
MVNILMPHAEMDHRTCSEYCMNAIVVHRDLLEEVTATIIGVGLDRILCDDKALDIGVEQTGKLDGAFHEAALSLS